MTCPDFQGIKLLLKQDEIKEETLHDGTESCIENLESIQSIGENIDQGSRELFSTMHAQDTVLYRGNLGDIPGKNYMGGKLRFQKTPQRSDDLLQAQMDLLYHKKAFETAKNELENKRLDLQQKKEEINIMRGELERRNVLLGLREDEVSGLRSELGGWRSGGLGGDVGVLREELTSSRKRLEEQSAEIHLLRDELEQRNIKIITLKKELDALRASVDATLQELPAFTDLSERSTGGGGKTFVHPSTVMQDTSTPRPRDGPSRPKSPNTLTAMCEFCNNEFPLQDNLAGLVIANAHFACEDCCRTRSKSELLDWTKSLTTDPAEVQPIRLWVTKKNNKSKSKLFRLFKK